MKLAFRPHGLDIDASYSHGLAAAFGLLAGIGGISLLLLPAGAAFAAGWGPLLLILGAIPLAIVAALRVLPRHVPERPLQVCLRYLALFSALLTVVGALTRFHLDDFAGVGLVVLAIASALLYGVLDHLDGGGADARAERAARLAQREATQRHVAEMHVAAQERLARHRRELNDFDRRLSVAMAEATAEDDIEVSFEGDDEAEGAHTVFVYDMPAAA